MGSSIRITITQQQSIISRKLNILELGEVLGNISEAYRRLGVSRQHYDDIKQVIEEDGLEELLEWSRESSQHRKQGIVHFPK